jgi:catechol 2,3-dioxygenase-like lactoylglutathione lyase family enzyme
VKIGNLTFDAQDPDRLATFWAAALGLEKAVYPDDMRTELLAAGMTEEHLEARALVEDPSGQAPRMLFQRVAEPKSAKNRLHMDVLAVPGRRAERAEVDAEMERLRGLGATLTRTHDAQWGPWPEYHHVMADPEGNEFCVQ